MWRIHAQRLPKTTFVLQKSLKLAYSKVEAQNMSTVPKIPAQRWGGGMQDERGGDG